MQFGAAEIARYNEDGFIVVEDVFTPQEIADLRRVTEGFVEQSRTVTEHDDVFDLEPGHTRSRPLVRRLKTPHRHDPVYASAAKSDRLLDILRQLIGPAIRFHDSKLNFKAAGEGASVEWHQDWAFYSHTNSDLCAVGVMLDDCAVENGPLLCIPGSHKGPVYDHHADGVFCGAIDPTAAPIDFDSAVPCIGPAGSVSIHHVKTIHGSALNTSVRDRRLLLYQYRAADAWPLAADVQPPSMEAWEAQLLCGDDDPVAPRMTAVPVRLPMPPAPHGGSIYENQRSLRNAYCSTGVTSAVRSA